MILKTATISEVVNIDSTLILPTNKSYTSENEVFIEDTTNTQEVNEFKLYPNPAKSFVNIDYLIIPEKETKIIILDGAGRVILNQLVKSNSNRIDISQYPAGSYYVKSVNGKRNFTKKLMIIK